MPKSLEGIQSKRKKLASLLRGKILVRLLTGGPQTSKEMVNTLRDCRFLNYSFWTVVNIWAALRRLKDLGKVKYDVRTCKWSRTDDCTTERD